MKVRITGHTKGLGKSLYNYFKDKFEDVKGFDSSNTVDEIIEQSQDCDLFINNTYTADNLQLTLLEKLYKQVDKMIVCGAIVSTYPDLEHKTYTDNKNLLEREFFKLASDKNETTDMLLLRLTSSSYKDADTIISSIEFWLSNPNVISLTYNVTD